MKTIVCSLLILVLTSTDYLSGQDIKDAKKSVWSVTIGYAPDYDFNLSKHVPSEGDVYYFLGFIGRVDLKFSDHLSISTGVYPRKREEDYLEMPTDSWTPHYLDAHETRFFLEFPVQINYYFQNSSKSLTPYLKLAIRNSYYNRKMVGVNQDGPISINDKQYNLLSDIGIGSNLKIIPKLSLVGEICFGYCLVYDWSNRSYIDALVGLQY